MGRCFHIAFGDQIKGLQSALKTERDIEKEQTVERKRMWIKD